MSAPDFDFRVCPVCGKTFIKPVESIYFMKDNKGRKEYYCSYTCYRFAQKNRYYKRKKATSEEESS